MDVARRQLSSMDVPLPAASLVTSDINELVISSTPEFPDKVSDASVFALPAVSSDDPISGPSLPLDDSSPGSLDSSLESAMSNAQPKLIENKASSITPESFDDEKQEFVVALDQKFNLLSFLDTIGTPESLKSCDNNDPMSTTVPASTQHIGFDGAKQKFVAHDLKSSVLSFRDTTAEPESCDDSSISSDMPASMYSAPNPQSQPTESFISATAPISSNYHPIQHPVLITDTSLKSAQSHPTTSNPGVAPFSSGAEGRPSPRCLKEVEVLGSLRAAAMARPRQGLFGGASRPIWTCLDVTDEWIAVGSHTGGLYLFDRVEDKLQHTLLPKSRGREISTRVKMRSSVDYVVALGSASGGVYIFQLPSVISRKQLLTYPVTESLHHGASITGLEWSLNAMKLFSGDSSGRVVCTEIDYILGQSRSYTVLQEPHAIIQLSYAYKTLLASTTARTVLVSSNSAEGGRGLESTDARDRPVVTQIGQQGRRIPGLYGATFIRGTIQSESAILFATRPDFCVWRSNLAGVVTLAHFCSNHITSKSRGVHFLSDAHSSSNIRGGGLNLGANPPPASQFGTIVEYLGGKFLLTHNECGFYVIKPQSGEIPYYHSDVGRLVDLVVNGDEIYLLCDGHAGGGRQVNRLVPSSDDLVPAPLLRQLASLASSSIVADSSVKICEVEARLCGTGVKFGDTDVKCNDTGRVKLDDIGVRCDDTDRVKLDDTGVMRNETTVNRNNAGVKLSDTGVKLNDTVSLLTHRVVSALTRFGGTMVPVLDGMTGVTVEGLKELGVGLGGVVGGTRVPPVAWEVEAVQGKRDVRSAEKFAMGEGRLPPVFETSELGLTPAPPIVAKLLATITEPPQGTYLREDLNEAKEFQGLVDEGRFFSRLPGDEGEGEIVYRAHAKKKKKKEKTHQLQPEQASYEGTPAKNQSPPIHDVIFDQSLTSKHPSKATPPLGSSSEKGFLDDANCQTNFDSASYNPLDSHNLSQTTQIARNCSDDFLQINSTDENPCVENSALGNTNNGNSLIENRADGNTDCEIPPSAHFTSEIPSSINARPRNSRDNKNPISRHLGNLTLTLGDFGEESSSEGESKQERGGRFWRSETGFSRLVDEFGAPIMPSCELDDPSDGQSASAAKTDCDTYASSRPNLSPSIYDDAATTRNKEPVMRTDVGYRETAFSRSGLVVVPGKTRFGTNLFDTAATATVAVTTTDSGFMPQGSDLCRTGVGITMKNSKQTGVLPSSSFDGYPHGGDDNLTRQFGVLETNLFRTKSENRDSPNPEFRFKNKRDALTQPIGELPTPYQASLYPGAVLQNTDPIPGAVPQTEDAAEMVSAPRKIFGDPLTVDQWLGLAAPPGGKILSLCVTSKHAYCTAGKAGAVYCSPLAGSSGELRWARVGGAKRAGQQIAVSPGGWLVWCLHHGTVFVADKMAVRGLGCGGEGAGGAAGGGKGEAVEWKEVARDVKCIAVDDSIAWYVKSNGSVMVQKDLTRHRPSYRSVPVPAPFPIASVVSRGGATWGVGAGGEVLVRVGVGRGTAEGTDWARVAGLGTSLKASSLSIGPLGRVFLTDTSGTVWFTTDVGLSAPLGSGLWWRVSPRWGPEGREPLAGLVAAGPDGALWVSSEPGRNSLRICWSDIIGYRLEVATPVVMVASTKWKTICAVSDSSESAVWLQQPNGSTFLVADHNPTPAPPQRIVEISPPVFLTPFASMAACRVSLWGVCAEGSIYVRRGVSFHCPEGMGWVKEDLSQLGGEVCISCVAVGTQNVWAVDRGGRVYLRIGPQPPSEARVNPAWLPVPPVGPGSAGLQANVQFALISTSPNDLHVWVVDSKGRLYVRCGVSESFPIGTHWDPVPGPVVGSSVLSLASSDTYLYALIGGGNCFLRHGVSRSSVAGVQWGPAVPGEYSAVTVNARDEVWLLDRERQARRLHVHRLTASRPPALASGLGPSNSTAYSLGSIPTQPVEGDWELL